MYVLKAADSEYLLDDHGEAKKYKGKRIKVTGHLDENHMIRAKSFPPLRMELSFRNIGTRRVKLRAQDKCCFGPKASNRSMNKYGSDR